MPKLTFEEWQTKVAQAMEKAISLGPDDIPDWDYRSAYDRGVKPESAARQAIKAAREG